MREVGMRGEISFEIIARNGVSCAEAAPFSFLVLESLYTFFYESGLF